uniref:Protein LEO1 homolog n=1 Tax=Elaeis guineensis var. tenera TaxID=51953 RepID=A0A6I9QBN4_ELAGV|nr:protein LEO1 homolog [Elaeis guineensis]XP_010906136.1 protein LEO1 homolog [Elaeis guineensis]
MGGEIDVEESTRSQVMQNLFGDHPEDEVEEDVASEHRATGEHKAAANRSGDRSGDGEDEVEGEEEVAVETEAERHDVDVDQGKSEGERIQKSPEREISHQRMENDGKDTEGEGKGYEQRVVRSRRQVVITSESAGSEDNHDADHDSEDADVNQAWKPGSKDEQKDLKVLRDVFGDSDEEEPAEYGAQNETGHDSHRSLMEEEGRYAKGLGPEEIVPDDEGQYNSQYDNLGKKPEKPVGPPLALEIPLHPPPGQPGRMNMIKVSNIMGFDPKPFDPKTYVEEDVFMTDKSGAQKRIHVEDNIVRWRAVQIPDGTTSYETNARFVRWEDGSIQLLIGNEVLNTSVHDSDHDQAHLFLQHDKGILQSQGRLLRKMRFMPSSLSSKSHRLLSALVESRNKKVHKVKSCNGIHQEREKEEKERVEAQTIRSSLLQKKHEKVNHKYVRTVSRGRLLPPGCLEAALDEDDEPEDYYSSRQSASVRSRFEQDMEADVQAERLVINAKRQSNIQKNLPRKSSLPIARIARHPVEEHPESESEESEYESKGDDIEKSTANKPDHEGEYKEDEADKEACGANSAFEEDEDKEQREKIKGTGGNSLKRKEIDGDSPPRKKTINRRKAVIFDSDEE